MARTRNLKPGFFKNDELAECSPWARLLFAGLWTLADRDGLLEYRPKKIKGELFPFDDVDVPELVAELHGRKFIVVYEVGGSSYLWLPTFKEHQRPHPKEPKSVLPQPPCETKTCDEAVEINGEPCKEMYVCALPSSNPLILSPSNPRAVNDSAPEPEPLPGEWAAATTELGKAGMATASSVCEAARARGCLPGEVLDLLRHWLEHPGAWSMGLLCSKIKGLQPGGRVSWPPPDASYTKKLEQEKRAREVAKQTAKRAVKASITDEDLEKRSAVFKSGLSALLPVPKAPPLLSEVHDE